MRPETLGKLRKNTLDGKLRVFLFERDLLLTNEKKYVSLITQT